MKFFDAPIFSAVLIVVSVAYVVFHLVSYFLGEI